MTRRLLHAVCLLALAADAVVAARAADVLVPLALLPILALALWALAPAPRSPLSLAAAPVLAAGAVAANLPWQIEPFGRGMLALAALLGAMLAALLVALAEAVRADREWPRRVAVRVGDDEPFDVAT